MRWRATLALGVGLLAVWPLQAQPERAQPERARFWSDDEPAASRSAPPKLRFLGMPSDLLTSLDEPLDAPAAYDVDYGEYYPYLDLRRPGDPTTMGYQKLFTRYGWGMGEGGQFAVNLLALTPAGAESGGLANGPTFVSPSITWTQAIGEGQAIHGFVGQHIHGNGRWRQNLDSGLLSGFAWQTAIPYCTHDRDGLFFFLQAQAAYRNEPNDTNVFWDVFPGVAWRVNDACWFTVGASRLNFLSCSWQY